MRFTLPKALFAIVLICCWNPAFAADYEVETVAQGLEHPWSLAFLPDGRMLVTERAGRLRVIADGELLPEPVAGVPEAYVADQGGLMEVLPAPDFEDSRLLYLSLADGQRGATATRVVRGQLDGNRLTEVEEIFRATPERGTAVHYGGRMLWLPDGTLVIGLGDGFNYREQAQNLDSHTGTIVRIHADGSIPTDNPFVDAPGALPEIYSHGHRNVQGLAYDSEQGILWQHEHGPQGGDLLNIIRPGANYGWPVTSHAPDYTGAIITPHRELAGMQSPVHVWTPAIAPAGLDLYNGELFADWQGNLLIAGLVSRDIHRLVIDDGKVIEEHRLLKAHDRRMRDVRVGPEGVIYVLTDHPDGEILRLTPPANNN